MRPFEQPHLIQQQSVHPGHLRTCMVPAASFACDVQQASKSSLRHLPGITWTPESYGATPDRWAAPRARRCADIRGLFRLRDALHPWTCCRLVIPHESLHPSNSTPSRHDGPFPTLSPFSCLSALPGRLHPREHVAPPHRLRQLLGQTMGTREPRVPCSTMIYVLTPMSMRRPARPPGFWTSTCWTSRWARSGCFLLLNR